MSAFCAATFSVRFTSNCLGSYFLFLLFLSLQVEGAGDMLPSAFHFYRHYHEGTGYVQRDVHLHVCAFSHSNSRNFLRCQKVILNFRWLEKVGLFRSIRNLSDIRRVSTSSYSKHSGTRCRPSHSSSVAPRLIMAPSIDSLTCPHLWRVGSGVVCPIQVITCNTRSVFNAGFFKKKNDVSFWVSVREFRPFSYLSASWRSVNSQFRL